jgi:FKBP-type peptidyl-prolyl cis-trans isomerase SlyD
MRVEKHKVVRFDYTLRNDGGEVLDTSEGGEPLEYVHGLGTMIPGLEKALAGRAVGEEFQVVIPAGEGYGEREDALVQEVSREQFEMDGELAVGTQFLAETEVGEHPFTVVAIDGDLVTVDGNHPLAGIDLHFQIAVTAVRDATPEEIEHGHGHDHGQPESGHPESGCCGGGCHED